MSFSRGNAWNGLFQRKKQELPFFFPEGMSKSQFLAGSVETPALSFVGKEFSVFFTFFGFSKERKEEFFLGTENPKSFLHWIKTTPQLPGLKLLSSSSQAPSRIFPAVMKSLERIHHLKIQFYTGWDKLSAGKPGILNPRPQWRSAQPSSLRILFQGVKISKGNSYKILVLLRRKHPRNSPGPSIHGVNEARRVLRINWAAIMQMRPELGQAERLPGAAQFPWIP